VLVERSVGMFHADVVVSVFGLYVKTCCCSWLAYFPGKLTKCKVVFKGFGPSYHHCPSK